MIRLSVASIGLLGAGFAIGMGGSRLVEGQPARPTAAPISQGPPQLSGRTLCKGGGQPQFEAELAVENGASAGKGPLRISLELHNDHPAQGTAMYAVELVADDGKVVTSLYKSLPEAVAAKARKRSQSIDLPALADGYYQVRATTAAIIGEAQPIVYGVLYLKATGGTVETIDVNRYLAESRANLENGGGL